MDMRKNAFLLLLTLVPLTAQADESALARKARATIQPLGEVILLYAHPFAHFRQLRYDRFELWGRSGVRVVFKIDYENDKGTRYSLEVIARVTEDGQLDGCEWGRDTGPFPPGLAVGLIAFIADYRASPDAPSYPQLTQELIDKIERKVTTRRQTRASYNTGVFHSPHDLWTAFSKASSNEIRRLQILSVRPSQRQPANSTTLQGNVACRRYDCWVFFRRAPKRPIGRSTAEVDAYSGYYFFEVDTSRLRRRDGSIDLNFVLTDHYHFNKLWKRTTDFKQTCLRLKCQCPETIEKAYENETLDIRTIGDTRFYASSRGSGYRCDEFALGIRPGYTNQGLGWLSDHEQTFYFTKQPLRAFLRTDDALKLFAEFDFDASSVRKKL